MRNATKKKSDITVRPEEEADRFERKRQIVNISKKRAPKIKKKDEFANTKRIEAAKLAISKKLKEEEYIVIEEGVADDIKMMV